MAYGAVTVTGTATLIRDANADRQSLYIFNNGTATIFLGPDSSVTDLTGFPLLPQATLDEDPSGTKQYTGPIYGITAGTSENVRYWERTIKS